jgi:hypothetical protein
MLVTKHGFEYQSAPYGKITYIPAGVPVIPATNLPNMQMNFEQCQYWVQEWEGMTEEAQSWYRNYGFLVDVSQVIESPFAVGQRVRMLPCDNWVAAKNGRYGIIQGATLYPGMSIINEDGRPSNNGEWAYMVASYRAPKAGAMWFSAKGLVPMKRVKTHLTNTAQSI